MAAPKSYRNIVFAANQHVQVWKVREGSLNCLCMKAKQKRKEYIPVFWREL